MKSQAGKPQLRNKEEFERLLKTYSPSQGTIDMLSKIRLVLLCGPTAAGRNTLISLLEETGHYSMLLSDTTRPKRVNNGVLEQHGKEYFFINEEEFINGLKSGQYIEAAIIHDQQVSGAGIKTLEGFVNNDKIALHELEINGVASFLKIKPDSTPIFMLPPSYDVWIQRLKGRGEMSEEELRRRLVSADHEIRGALNSDKLKFLVNDEIHEFAKRVDDLVRNGIDVSDEEQAHGRAHAEQLAIDVQLFLRS